MESIGVSLDQKIAVVISFDVQLHLFLQRFSEDSIAFDLSLHMVCEQ